MITSILEGVKKNLGITKEYEHFDADIIMNVNMALMTLTQLGLGNPTGFKITGYDETIEDFVGSNEPMYEAIMMYLYLRTKIIFDPPGSSYVLQAYKDQIAELETRLTDDWFRCAHTANS